MSEEILKLNADSEKLPELLLELAQKGNKTAKEIWDDFGKALACGIASLVHTLGSFHFIIGGGLAGAWDQFYPACEREISKRLYTSTLDRVKIVCAQLGNEAGLMGGVPLINEGLVLHK
jgi:glucokinase